MNRTYIEGFNSLFDGTLKFPGVIAAEGIAQINK